MVDTRILLAATWAALMLTYLLGDVLRIFAGDFEPGRDAGAEMGQWGWFGIAALMLVPIVMILLTLTLPQAPLRWVAIVAAAILFVFNALGLPSYEAIYDRFLILVGLVINALTIWWSWAWRV